MPFRRRSTEKSYLRYLKEETLAADNCPFCDIKNRKILYEGKAFRVVENIYPYDIWDDLKVLDHLLIVPRRHIAKIADFTKAEDGEYMKIVHDFDKKGYSLYARSAGNSSKSIVHQHSHLIKTANKKISFWLYLHRPYLFFTRFVAK